jgi:hypothetical protein
MDALLEAIRGSLQTDAPPEARAAGAQACRTILTALESTAGQPMTAAPTAPPTTVAAVVGALRGVPPEQLLDLAIAKLRAALPAGVEARPVQPLNFYLPTRRGG